MKPFRFVFSWFVLFSLPLATVCWGGSIRKSVTAVMNRLEKRAGITIGVALDPQGPKEKGHFAEPFTSSPPYFVKAGELFQWSPHHPEVLQ